MVVKVAVDRDGKPGEVQKLPPFGVIDQLLEVAGTDVSPEDGDAVLLGALGRQQVAEPLLVAVGNFDALDAGKSLVAHLIDELPEFADEKASALCLASLQQCCRLADWA